MTANQSSATEIISEQRRRQEHLDRKRLTWWIPMIFIVGFGFSALGLFTSIVSIKGGDALKARDIFFTGFFLFFGGCVGAWLISPFRIQPRIVPYFAREIVSYGGKTSAAFRRGRGLYTEIVALDQIAASLGVIPLSAFGFADDYYEQKVSWHPAAAGLRTAEALRSGLSEHLLVAPGLIEDLDTLVSVLREAADRGVDFCLVLRLYRQDSIQGVSTWQARQGAFW